MRVFVSKNLYTDIIKNFVLLMIFFQYHMILFTNQLQHHRLHHGRIICKTHKTVQAPSNCAWTSGKILLSICKRIINKIDLIFSYQPNQVISI